MGMIGTARPLASLSSGLLARKGQARPAMRPQAFIDNVGAGMLAPTELEDLGWNDMGSAGAELPPVLNARAALREVIEAPVAEAPPARPVSPATAARIGRESAALTAKGKGKAAFTLRLDAERHLRLRLAGAVAGRSAQQLVTEALDQFLKTMPAVDQLAEQLPRPTGRSRT